MKKIVALCESQPVTAEGLRALLATSPDFELSGGVMSHGIARDVILRMAPNILIMDKAFGTQSVLECLEHLKGLQSPTASIVWGSSMTQAETLRFIQAGAKGIIRKSTDLDSLLICLRSVASGATWMEDNVFHEAITPHRESRTMLTPREQQVMQLAGQGLKNREIAAELGIRAGTVKVHLKHVFEKTGVQGRYSLTLAGMGFHEPLSRMAATAI